MIVHKFHFFSLPNLVFPSSADTNDPSPMLFYQHKYKHESFETICYPNKKEMQLLRPLVNLLEQKFENISRHKCNLVQFSLNNLV